MVADSERLLIQHIRRGDARAWEQLIDKYEGRLLAFVSRRLKDHAACEDVVQETFIGFLNSLPNFDDRRELQTYLFTIASHKLTDHLRRLGRHPLHQAGEETFEQELDSQPGVSSLARSRERRDLESRAVSEGLKGLLDHWRSRGEYDRIKVLELLFVKGMANKDTAVRLGISEQQVANIRFAAVRKMHEKVRDLGLPADVFPELRLEDG